MQLVVFKLLDKEYALNVKDVIQVVRNRKIISIPQAPDFVEGVIAWHGKVIPLISLRKKLGFSGSLPVDSSRFIILKVNNHNLGIIVDSVTEVINFDNTKISSPDEFFKEAEYLIGVIKIGSRIVLFMDVEKLFSHVEVQEIGVVHSCVQVRSKE